MNTYQIGHIRLYLIVGLVNLILIVFDFYIYFKISSQTSLGILKDLKGSVNLNLGNIAEKQPKNEFVIHTR